MMHALALGFDRYTVIFPIKQQTFSVPACTVKVSRLETLMSFHPHACDFRIKTGQGSLDFFLKDEQYACIIYKFKTKCYTFFIILFINLHLFVFHLRLRMLKSRRDWRNLHVPSLPASTDGLETWNASCRLRHTQKLETQVTSKSNVYLTLNFWVWVDIHSTPFSTMR